MLALWANGIRRFLLVVQCTNAGDEMELKSLKHHLTNLKEAKSKTFDVESVIDEQLLSMVKA